MSMALNINDEPFDEGEDAEQAAQAEQAELAKTTTRVQEVGKEVLNSLKDLHITDAPSTFVESPSPEVNVPTFDPLRNAPPSPDVRESQILAFPAASSLPESEVFSKVGLAERLFDRAMAPSPLSTVWPSLREQ
jgi:hypothetical protein